MQFASENYLLQKLSYLTCNTELNYRNILDLDFLNLYAVVTSYDRVPTMKDFQMNFISFQLSFHKLYI